MVFLKLSPKGFSLVEIIVAVGVGAVVFGFISDLLVKQHKEQKFLAQKFEINDFKNNLLNTLAKKNNCSCQFANNATNPNFTNYAALKFNSTIIDGSESINTAQLFSSCAGGLNPPLLLAGNNQLLNGSQSLVVETVRIIDLKPSGGSVNPLEWQGQWEIKFKVGAGSLDRQVKPVLITQKFIVDNTTPADTRITSCEGLSTGSGTSNYISKWSAVPGVLEDSAFFQDSITNNIGLGTTTPKRQFTIKSAVTGPIAALENTDSLGWALWSPDLGGRFEIAEYTDLGWTIPNTLSRFTINRGGNIGIGTMAPNAAIVVKRDVPANTPNGLNVNIYENGGTLLGGGAAIRLFTARGTATAPTAVLAGDVIGNYNFSGMWTGKLSPQYEDGDYRAGTIALATEDWTSSTNNGTSLTFQTTNNGANIPTVKMLINHNGNVGINNGAPSTKLDIGGSLRADASTSMPSVGYISFGQTGLGPIVDVNYSGGGDSQFFFTHNGDSTNGATNFMWQDNATSRNLMSIRNDGHIGIGTTSPLSALHIQRNGEPQLWVGANTGANTAGIQLMGGPTGDSEIIFGGTGMQNRAGIGITGTKLNLYTASFPRLTADATGRIGIGTTSPGYLVDVQGGGVNASGGFTNVSDINLKTNIEYLNSKDTLEKILTLRGIFFDWKNKEALGSERQLGLIAQDVEKVFPEVVTKNNEGILSLSYSYLVAAVIEAIKEIHTQFLEHSEELKSIKAQNIQLKSEVTAQNQKLLLLEKRLDSQSKELQEIKNLIKQK